jgi:hypothetical protein
MSIPAPPADQPMLLRVGVTGHRNFATNDARLGAIVRRELQAQMSAHPGRRLHVITALAEGADRLVARIAIDEFGASLSVTLPMPRSGYEKDFASTESRKEFAGMLAEAIEVVEAPLLSPGDAWRDYTEERNHQYAWGGAYVALASECLMALWDGKAARGTGGTAHVVDWFLHGGVPPAYSIDAASLSFAGRPRTFIHIVPDTGDVHRQVVG